MLCVCILVLACRWPSLIRDWQNLLMSMMGSQPQTSYSPACFWSDADSSLQAQAEVIGSLVMCLMVLAVCCLLWTAR